MALRITSPFTEGNRLQDKLTALTKLWPCHEKERNFGHVMRKNDDGYPKIALLGGVYGIR